MGVIVLFPKGEGDAGKTAVSQDAAGNLHFSIELVNDDRKVFGSVYFIGRPEDIRALLSSFNAKVIQ